MFQLFIIALFIILVLGLFIFIRMNTRFFHRLKNIEISILKEINKKENEQKKITSEINMRLKNNVDMLQKYFNVIEKDIVSFHKNIKKEKKKKEQLIQKIVNIEENERRNLSSQIHDQLSQNLAALSINLDLLDNKVGEKDMDKIIKIKKMRWILHDLVEKSHNISDLLRPPEIDELGLDDSISYLIKRNSELTRCKYKYENLISNNKIDSRYTLTIYRIVQEALTNIAKHAKAKNVSVKLWNRKKTIYLTIEDDGIGFNYNKYKKMKYNRDVNDISKLGLQGLNERIIVLGGVLKIRSSSGKGTQIYLRL